MMVFETDGTIWLSLSISYYSIDFLTELTVFINKTCFHVVYTDILICRTEAKRCFSTVK